MVRRKAAGGSTILEFTLCGIPMLFAWISIVQMGMGMWHYATLQYAVKACGAYVATHGQSYIAAGNTAKQIKDAAAILKSQAIGMPASSIQVTFYAVDSGGTSTSHTCAASGSNPAGTLAACTSDSTVWPPTGSNFNGNDIKIKANYVWNSALAMVAPGPGTGPVKFGTFNLPGYTHQFIVF